MVNKTAVGLLGVVVVASLGVGVIVGMQLGGADAPTAATPSTDGTSQTPTDASDEESEETATPAHEQTDQHTEIPARQFDDEEIARYVAEFVNEERAAHEESALRTDDATATGVSAMANDHSVAMADHGTVAHEIDDVSTSDRYENSDLYDRCKFKSSEGSYIRTPDESFELVDTSYAGVAYEDGGEQQFNADERDVARAIVDDWIANSTYSERLLVTEPTRMGVGIEVTADGKVFATVDVCA
jgi:hypothetical protein